MTLRHPASPDPQVNAEFIKLIAAIEVNPQYSVIELESLHGIRDFRLMHAEHGYAGGFMLSETDEWQGQAERIHGNLKTLREVRHLVERR